MYLNHKYYLFVKGTYDNQSLVCWVKKGWDWLCIFLQDALLKEISRDRDRDRDTYCHTANLGYILYSQNFRWFIKT